MKFASLTYANSNSIIQKQTQHKNYICIAMFILKSMEEVFAECKLNLCQTLGQMLFLLLLFILVLVETDSPKNLTVGRKKLWLSAQYHELGTTHYGLLVYSCDNCYMVFLILAKVKHFRTQTFHHNQGPALLMRCGLDNNSNCSEIAFATIYL